MLVCSHIPEMEQHAAFLCRLGDHLKAVQAAVAVMTVPAAERYEWAVKTIVPGTIFVHIPQTVLICTDCTYRIK